MNLRLLAIGIVLSARVVGCGQNPPAAPQGAASPQPISLAPATPSDEKKDSAPKVTLRLIKASAQQRDKDILFTCKAVIDNQTDAILIVKSNFSSAFDGLGLLIADAESRTLAQPVYVWQQSPLTGELRDFPLKVGKTEQELVFPASDLPKDCTMFKVKLVGTLWRSEYKEQLTSKALEVALKPKD